MHKNLHFSNISVKGVFMTHVDHLLVSRFYQISKIAVILLESTMPKIKNEELKTIISNQMSTYDVLSKECCTMAKSHLVALPDNAYFKRCRELIVEAFNNISSVNLQTLIACTTLLSLNALTEIYDVEMANSETINLGKHLQNIIANNLQVLTEIKL